MSWAKKIKRNQMAKLTERKPTQLDKARKKASQLEWETTQQALYAMDDLIMACRAFSAVYVIYILLNDFHVPSKKIVDFDKHLVSMNGVVKSHGATFDELVSEIIKAKDNNGCKFPDFVPCYDVKTFEPKRLQMLDKLRQAGKPLKQAMVSVKRYEYMQQMYNELEILTMVALHDGLGFSRKRLSRFLERFRELRQSSVAELHRILDVLIAKKCDFSQLVIDWKLLEEMEILQCC